MADVTIELKSNISNYQKCNIVSNKVKNKCIWTGQNLFRSDGNISIHFQMMTDDNFEKNGFSDNCSLTFVIPAQERERESSKS